MLAELAMPEASDLDDLHKRSEVWGLPSPKRTSTQQRMWTELAYQNELDETLYHSKAAEQAVEARLLMVSDALSDRSDETWKLPGRPAPHA